MTSWGVLADVNLAVERGIQWLPRQWRLWLAALKALVFLRPKRGTLTLKVKPSSVAELENKPLAEPQQRTIVLQGAFTLVSISNVRQLSQQVVLASDARPDDGRLHVSVVRHCSRLHALRTVLAAFAGEEISDFFWIDSYVCSEVAIANESGEVDICGFGEEELDPVVNSSEASRTVLVKSQPRAMRVFYASSNS
jgi:diacylglycerol kinase family enzyme